MKRSGGPSRRPAARFVKPTLEVFTTTLWDFPSQHYNAGQSTMQGDSRYVGATPSWVIWQLLQRYTKPGETVLDPMCGSGTTLDVCADLGRVGVGFDLVPQRPDIQQADARRLTLQPMSIDFAFVDPPYSTHVDYSDDPACIGKLDAGGEDQGRAYYSAMRQVIGSVHRALKPGRHMALYVSDSWAKRAGEGRFMPIGFELFAIMRTMFEPVDIIAVVRHNQKLGQGNWHKAARESNFFLRGFNYLFIMKKAAGKHAGR